eukprot:scaffold3604_cov83-Skeletonema_dohrnii-CCMP3373.AAC.7
MVLNRVRVTSRLNNQPQSEAFISSKHITTTINCCCFDAIKIIVNIVSMMNGNDESTASVQPSCGSVVDGPSASTVTFTTPSSNGGARTTPSEDDSASQPNDGTQLSEQMQQLNIGRNRFNQSNHLSLPELRAYCQSDSLTERGLRERLSRLNLQVEDLTFGILLFDVCHNEQVTHEVVQCVIEHVPGAASAVTTGGLRPLHVVCSNKNVTRDIFRCVYEGNSDAMLAQDERGELPLDYLYCNRRVDDTVVVEIMTWFLEEGPNLRSIAIMMIRCGYKFRSPEFCCMLIQALLLLESNWHEVEGESILFDVLHLPDVFNDSVVLAVLKILLEKYPDMLRDFRWNGCSVLHDAALTHLPRAVEVCRLIIQAFPELVLELHGSTDDLQLQPLHLACASGNLPVVKCILDMCPDAIRGESSDGDFPIHYAVCALTRTPEAAVEVVKFLLSVDPSVASQEGIAFPLIYAYACLETNASNLTSGLEVIKLLYNAYPEAIVNAEASFRRGIDINETPVFVRRFFVNQLRYVTQASNLQLVRSQDENGMLPLHRALLEDAPLGTIKLFVQADPSTLQIPDSDGSLPLHIAASKYECPDVIKYLVDLNIGSLLVTDNWGDTPLHNACLEERYAVIEMFLTRYPNAPVTRRNLDGDLPIQLLLDCDDQESADYASCIFLLLKASPEMWMSNEDLVLALTS